MEMTVRGTPRILNLADYMMLPQMRSHKSPQLMSAVLVKVLF
jgi:hypothetical protein